MAVCNTFNKLTNKTGSFLSFEQYTKDLTRWATESDLFRVVPSKFIALELNYKEFTNELLKDPSTDLNIDIPRYFQNIFENACSYCAANPGDNLIYDQENTKSLFWWTMIQSKLIHKEKETIDDLTKYYIPEIKYIGDINIQNYDEIDGVGYSDIFCYIPNNIERYKYYSELGSNVEEMIIDNPNTYIEGYSKDDKLPLNGEINPNIKYQYNFNAKHIISDHYIMNDDVNKYNINAIIVLYDIYNKNSITPLYEEIPMGIYFPGIFDENNQMTNIITKYIYNSDTYGAGTSYGLRICTKFTVTPNSTLTGENADVIINVKQDNDYTAFSQVMSSFADTYSKLNELIEHSINNAQTNKEFFAQFKNYRVNVPYIKRIGGTDEYPINHWFVNGRDIGSDGLTSAIPYEDEEVQNTLKEWNGDYEENK